MIASLPTDEQLARIVRSLPAAPRILAELAPRLQDVDAEISDVTAILRRDSALTARLIDMANSVAFVGFEPSTSIEEAVARVGYSETCRIVGAVASTQLADEPLQYYGIQPRRFRENALFTALVMEELADDRRIDSRTAYTVGLLRSIGKVVLERLARQTGQASRFDAARQHLVEWERANWQRTNAEVGAQVLARWEFPAEAIDALRHHYSPEMRAGDLSCLLNIAAGAAEARGFGLPGEHAYWRHESEIGAHAGVDESQIAWATDHAQSTLAHVSLAFA